MTLGEIEKDVMDLLRESTFAKSLTGKVYYANTRPANSTAEDAVVKAKNGTAGEVQLAVVWIGVYVPWTEVNAKGQLGRNTTRTRAIEKLSNDWVKSLQSAHSKYLVRLNGAIGTTEDETPGVSIVATELLLKCLYTE